MKKKIILLVGVVMSVCCFALLFLQVSYIDAMVRMRKGHFEEGVRRALYQVAYNLEMDEMREYLSQDVRRDILRGQLNDNGIKFEHSYVSSSESGDVVSKFEFKTFILNPPHFENKALEKGQNLSVEEAQRLSLDVLRMRYKYQRALLDEVVYNMLYQASEKPLKSRIDFQVLDRDIKLELANNGIDMPYHFRVLSNDMEEVYRCADFEEDKQGRVYSETLFKNDPPARMAMLEIIFPSKALNKYIYGSVKFMLPSMLFTLVLLITFVITLYMAVRHKKITEMKNDFINNMTHEFKTPISTISLAAQMLQDQSVVKSPEMFSKLSGVISSETKRLRFQVDKVLQMSMFDDKNTASLKMKELDAHELLSGIINTFAVKVEQNGGVISSKLEAGDPFIYVDEMHFTNVVFNLMDNAMKYKRPDVPMSLEIRTWNVGDKFVLSVKDNGVGISKDNLKKIFDKFYRVQTGNVHDVKGFGLGLAYVKQMVKAHRGTIRAESELGVGTTFIIVLPLK
jgi:two-component system phosphate regulon sensor histidine kinase PhoR